MPQASGLRVTDGLTKAKWAFCRPAPGVGWRRSGEGGMKKSWAAIVVGALCLFSGAGPLSAADGAPTGAWRTTNQCFLAAFLLTDDGRAEAIYLSGERDTSAVW